MYFFRNVSDFKDSRRRDILCYMQMAPRNIQRAQATKSFHDISEVSKAVMSYQMDTLCAKIHQAPDGRVDRNGYFDYLSRSQFVVSPPGNIKVNIL